MVQSTVASSILGGLQSVLKAPGALEANRSRQLDNQEAARLSERQGDQDLVAQIEAAGDYRIDPTDTSGALFRYDFQRIAEDRPDLAIGILNTRPEFNIALDENGRKIATQVSDILKNDDGTLSILVTRPDGRKVPLTENRTAQGDDVVVKLDRDDFNTIGTNRMSALVAMGAGNNASTFLRDAGRLVDASLRETALDNVANNQNLAEDPAAKSQLFKILNTASGEELKTIAADLGVDVASVTAAANDRASELGIPDKAEQEPAPTLDPNVRPKYSLTNRAQAQAKRAERFEASADTDERKNAAQRARELADSTREDMITKRDELREEIEQLKSKQVDSPRRSAREAPSGKRRGVGKQLATRTRRIEKLQAEVDEYTSFLGDGAPTEQGQQVLESGAPEPETPVFNREQLLGAIRDNLATPTPEQYETVSRYLQEKGVTKAEDLRKLPSRDAHMAAWLMASRQPGSTADKAALANSLLNYVDTGSQETNIYQANQQRLDKNKYLLDLAKTTNSNIAAFDAAIREAVDEYSEMRKSLYDPDTGELRVTEEANTRLDNIWKNYRNFSASGPNKEAYSRIVMESLLSHMQAVAATKTPGFFEIGNRLSNWFNDDGKLRIGDAGSASLVRVLTDSNGRPRDLYFKNPNGGKFDFEINIGSFRRIYGDEVLSSIIALANSNTETGGR